MIFKKRALEEILKTKKWISVKKDNTFLHWSNGLNISSKPPKTLLRIPLKIWTRITVRVICWKNLSSAMEIFC